MTKVLIVDDDPDSLNGIRRILGVTPGEWQGRYATSGQQALEMLEAASFGVIIAGKTMSDMPGSELLSVVKRRYPKTVRVLMAVESDLRRVLGAAGPALRCLTKPCTPASLTEGLSRACSLAEMLQSEILCDIAGSVDKLYSPPKLYFEMLDLLRDPKTSIRDVADLVATDAAMTAKVLQIVNSAYVGLSRRMTSPQEAAIYLGLNAIQGLVLSAGVFSMYVPRPGARFQINALWQHSMSVAAGARAIARADGHPAPAVDQTFTAAMLHDVGIAVLAQHLESRYDEILVDAKDRGIGLCDAEQEALGHTHEAVGAFLLALWGIPDAIVDIVGHHHTAGGYAGADTGPLAAVHASEALLKDETSVDMVVEELEPDWSHLDRLGLAGRLDAWRDIIAEQSGHRAKQET